MANKKHDQTPKIMGGPTDRRTLNVMLGTGVLNQIDQTRRVQSEQRIVGDKKEWLPWPLRVLSVIGGLFLLLGCVETVLLFITVDGERAGRPWLVALGLGIGIPVYGGLRLLEAWLERRDWVRRMREADAEKERNK